jgi:hypothetical protein
MVMGLALVLAGLALTAMSAGVAAAEKPVLVLREGGEHLYEGLDPVVAEGAHVEVSVEVTFGGGCATAVPFVGAIETNNSKDDTVTFRVGKVEPPGVEVPCGGEYEGKHDIMFVHPGRKLVLNDRGEAAAKTPLAVETQNAFGPCLYIFGLKKMTFPMPTPSIAGETVLTGMAKSAGRGSGAKACKVRQETTVTITVADNGGHPLETTLEG